MKEEIEQLLLLIKTGQVPGTEIQNFTDRIRLSIKEDASRGKELGELLSKIKQAIKNSKIHTDVNWVAIDKGYLAIGHKPGGKIPFEGLQKEGTSVVLTLLNENEGALAIGKQLKNVTIEWIWFPFSASRPHEGDATSDVLDLYRQLATLLKQGKKIYIHCSAGIHRTGMITYGFLRFLGIAKGEAIKKLTTLRAVTAEQVGGDRLIWGEQFKSSVDPEI